MINVKRMTAIMAAVGIWAIASTSATGSMVQFTGSSGTLAASATFDLTGSTLTVTLANTATSDVLVPTDVLEAVLFNTSHTLTPVSASLNGSTVYYKSIVNNVGEGWQYGSGVSAHGMNSGISAAGYGVFGSAPWFYTPPQPPLDGTDYGILSAGDDPLTGNTGVTGHGPLIKNSIQFTLTAASGFSLDELGSSIVFQYGTDLTDAHFDGTPSNPSPVPEPTTMLAGALLLLPFGASALRILRKSRKA